MFTYPEVGGVSGKVLIHLSSLDLKTVNSVQDLISAGTILNKAGPTEENELKIVVLTLRTLDLPSSRIHVGPLRSD